MQRRYFSKVVTFILIDDKEKNIQPHQMSVFLVPESLIHVMYCLKSFANFQSKHFHKNLANCLKGTRSLTNYQYRFKTGS